MDILNLLTSNRVSAAFINEASKDIASRISNNPGVVKAENILKLIYKLFLYSVIGFFAKLISKFFKL